ncbi:MAG: peptide chain release factor N(5)-glutamine methyltransferase [SAR202 cluster bacterium]|nr:peptide chain release factor N(5)-glutamine methyltransferase [SAR202 cluster bacterium]|tara:strand:- start:530 stop:1384 length:855 start_codon:yes stop_codon:yes gene_type:complete
MTPPTVSSLIRLVTERLTKSGIEEASTESRLLIRSAFGWSAIEQFTNLDDTPPTKHLEVLESHIRRRESREPLQYITGTTEFYSRQFSVNESVLIPRPETEQLVSLAIEFVRTQNIGDPKIADIGTGSGAIAISLALEMPSAKIYATDISGDAVIIARQNAENLGAELDICKGNLLDPLDGQYDVIVSNPPYILSGQLNSLQAEVRKEPILALDGGNDGLGVIRPLLANIKNKLKENTSAVFIEIDPPVEHKVMQMAQSQFPHGKISLLSDLSGLSRYITIEHI